MLDKTVGYVVATAGLMYLKCCFADDRLALAISNQDDGKKKNQQQFAAMVADKKRHTKYFWPELYPDSKSKRAIRNIANGIIQAGRGDTTQYGGFSTQVMANESRSYLWTLAEVLYSMAPRIAPMRNRSMPIPVVFSDLAEQVSYHTTALIHCNCCHTAATGTLHLLTRRTS
jgi:hypothetical protein